MASEQGHTAGRMTVRYSAKSVALYLVPLDFDDALRIPAKLRVLELPRDPRQGDGHASVRLIKALAFAWETEREARAALAKAQS